MIAPSVSPLPFPPLVSPPIPKKHDIVAAIIAVGYKVNSERALQFRKWATTIVEEFAVKGYTMDDQRLKSGGSVLTERYFEEQLQRVREIRLSEQVLPEDHRHAHHAPVGR